ncbi:hypothetical protein BD770DRAFT_441331 [Pilaira anomala]|nr:hypothetical protein BD770DRAFT_441331 [Pilaira anomala]
MILSSRNRLLSIILFSFIAISFSLVVPIQQQSFQTTSSFPVEVNSIKKVPSLLSLENDSLLNNLEAYYSKIATEVLDSTISEIMETVSETYLTIHQLQFAGREYCHISVAQLMQVLEYELEHQVKDSLLGSIGPLIKLNYKENTNLMELNTMISEQLGLLVNAKQVADNVMKQIYQEKGETYFSSIWKSMFDKKWAETVRHERNEIMALKAWLSSWLLDIEFTLKDTLDTEIALF